MGLEFADFRSISSSNNATWHVGAGSLFVDEASVKSRHFVFEANHMYPPHFIWGNIELHAGLMDTRLTPDLDDKVLSGVNDSSFSVLDSRFPERTFLHFPFHHQNQWESDFGPVAVVFWS